MQKSRSERISAESIGQSFTHREYERDAMNSAATDIRRYLGIHSATAPTFSPPDPKGRSFDRVLFLMNATGVPQVWSVPVGGGWPTQLTFYSEAVRFVSCPPIGDGGRWIFGMDSGGNERTQLYLAERDGFEVIDLSGRPDAVHEWGGWSPDGKRIAFSANRSIESRFDLYIQEVDGDRSARLLCAGPGGVFNAGEFSPDGKYLLAIECPSNRNQFIHVVDRMTGGSCCLTPHEGETRFLNPRWSADGTRIFVLTDLGGDFLSLAMLEVASGELNFIRRPDWDVESAAVSRDEAWLAWSVNQAGISRLFVQRGRHGRPKALTNLPAGVIGRLAFSPEGRCLAFEFTGPLNNPDVWVCDLKHAIPRKLTHASRQGLPQRLFVEPTPVVYRTFDGLEIPAWLYLPRPGAPATRETARPPAIIYPHGGPEGQSRPAFNPIFAYLLNRGYAVFAPNVRGSSGYGTRFMNLDNVELRMDSVTDLAYGALWLRDSGRIDPKRMAVYGASYGGFMALASVSTYPDLYAAAIDVVGITNLITFLENTGPYRRAAREAEYGSLERDRVFLESISPIRHVNLIKTPMMVIHGANDPRVPVGEAEQIVAALKAQHVPVEYLRYEDEGHGLIKLSNRLDAYPRMVDFLDRYLAG